MRTVQAGQSLAAAMHELAARGVHRLALVEPSDPLQITNIVSQTSVVSFLYKCDLHEAAAAPLSPPHGHTRSGAAAHGLTVRGRHVVQGD